MSVIRSNALRKSARGMPCTLRLPCCNCDPQTTVLAHLPDESHGMSRKSDDISACYACSACHAAIDGRGADGATKQELDVLKEWYMRRAMVRTLRLAIQAGVVRLGGAHE